MRKNVIKEPFKYNDDHLQFIKENVEGKYIKELTELFNQHFGTDLSEGQIRGFKKRFKLKSGIDCTFKKGMPSHNKGKKIYHITDMEIVESMKFKVNRQLDRMEREND